MNAQMYNKARVERELTADRALEKQHAAVLRTGQSSDSATSNR